ncbi:crosslink repair DNA glycosylase YcaQ family protein [Nocardioides zeae]|uniref:Crosslink repair DNA glycosylase YcaQ family protein n=1 Tax=Nocardioides imazamoxiresistens TaxID=3231893 RepID=A0ABU3Q0J6_9ACTN|nr:crosslink repair DNA glycosylase YcaQ family protein [Nocardioides zeae]MDT9594914.1 crosslink repair DNA glycosylase YcaQ family protein [Nocardioides zeae]
MSRPTELSLPQARRIALAAQGFRDPAHAVPTMRTFDRTLRRTGLLQIDSVNVLERAHYMPLYARMGAYDRSLLDRASGGTRRDRRVVEYWAHEAAFTPVDALPHLRHRMERWRERYAVEGIGVEQPELVREVAEEVAARGRVTARDLDDGRPRDRVHWGWNWSDAKRALEMLMRTGDLVVAGRNGAFERLYDVPERVLPRDVVDAATPSVEDAVRELVRRGARSHGIGTTACFADYFRLRLTPAAQAVAELVEAGELEPVRVRGWDAPTYLHVDAALPRRVDARTLLSPFDPVVWFRPRAEALFDFHYRIEIYTPAERRVHGYYVLPFLLGDRVVARVDLKADRRAAGGAGVLRVLGAYAEGHAPATTAAELALELDRLRGWTGLGSIEVAERGDLAAALRGAVGTGSGLVGPAG